MSPESVITYLNAIPKANATPQMEKAILMRMSPPRLALAHAIDGGEVSAEFYGLSIDISWS